MLQSNGKPLELGTEPLVMYPNNLILIVEQYRRKGLGTEYNGKGKHPRVARNFFERPKGAEELYGQEKKRVSCQGGRDI